MLLISLLLLVVLGIFTIALTSDNNNYAVIIKRILKLLGILLLFILFISLCIFLFSDTFYCMDGQTEDLLRQIAKKRDMCEYFQQQVWACNENINEITSKRGSMNNADWERDFEYAKLAMRETETNLNMEKKILNSLEGKLRSGNYYELSDNSTVQKRKAGDFSESSSSSAVQKRKPGDN